MSRTVLHGGRIFDGTGSPVADGADLGIQRAVDDGSSKGRGCGSPSRC
jgi:hypothetical protein